MKALILAGVTSIVLLTGEVVGQETAKPGSERERLCYWVGTWGVDVENKESPLAPAGQESWTFNFEWFPGRFHLVFRSELKGSDGETADLGLFGYDTESSTYFFDQIMSTGMAFFFKVVREETVWRFTCDRTLGG